MSNKAITNTKYNGACVLSRWIGHQEHALFTCSNSHGGDVLKPCTPGRLYHAITATNQYQHFGPAALQTSQKSAAATATDRGHFANCHKYWHRRNHPKREKERERAEMKSSEDRETPSHPSVYGQKERLELYLNLKIRNREPRLLSRKGVAKDLKIFFGFF